MRPERGPKPNRSPQALAARLRALPQPPLPADALSQEEELPTEPMLLNLGPSHPATHGTVRIVAELDGEIIRKADVEVHWSNRIRENRLLL